MTMTLSKPEAQEQDTVLFLESDLTQQEWTERQADELAIELAGKDRLEKALIIGEKLSHIYNSGSFRRSAPGGERWTWEDWVNKRLPGLLPGEALKLDAADNRRFLYEVRQLVSPGDCAPAASLPTSANHAAALKALIPRALSNVGGWAPAILDDPVQAQGVIKVWELALENAAIQQRKNGPTADDVRSAREELRPQLLQMGLIRETPKSLQQSAAERMAHAAARRERVIDIDPIDVEAQRAATEKVLQSIRAESPVREQQARVAAVKEELSRPDREKHERLQAKVREYNSKLNAVSNAAHELLVFLRSIDRIDGTKYLDDMRATDVLGLITVRDDLNRLQVIGKDLMEVMALAQSSNPPTGIDMATVNV